MKNFQIDLTGKVNNSCVSGATVKGYSYSENNKAFRLFMSKRNTRTEARLDGVTNKTIGSFENGMICENVYVWQTSEAICFNNDIQIEAWDALLSYFSMDKEGLKRLALSYTKKILTLYLFILETCIKTA